MSMNEHRDFEARNAAAQCWKAPLTARSDGWAGWALLFLASGGLVGPVLGAYLGYWLYQHSKQRLSLLMYGLLAIFYVCSLLASKSSSKLPIWEYVDWAITFAWFAAGFVLRAEILSYYKQAFGMELEISRWKTLFFSSLYLNWCLAVYRP